MAVVRRWAAAWNDHNPDAAVSLLKESYVRDDANGPEVVGPAGTMVLLQGIFDAFPNLRLDEAALISEGGWWRSGMSSPAPIRECPMAFPRRARTCASRLVTGSGSRTARSLSSGWFSTHWDSYNRLGSFLRAEQVRSLQLLTAGSCEGRAGTQAPQPARHALCSPLALGLRGAGDVAPSGQAQMHTRLPARSLSIQCAGAPESSTTRPPAASADSTRSST